MIRPKCKIEDATNLTVIDFRIFELPTKHGRTFNLMDFNIVKLSDQETFHPRNLLFADNKKPE